MAKQNHRSPHLIPQPKKGLGEDDPNFSLDDDVGDDDDLSVKVVPVICRMDSGARLEINRRRIRMRKGEVIEVEAAYGTPRVFRPGGDPLPSVVELESGGKVLPVADPRIDKDKATGKPILWIERQQKEMEDTRRAQEAAARQQKDDAKAGKHAGAGA